jgi:hypothetical protein
MATAGVDREVEKLLALLTLAEKLSLLDGDWPFWSGIRDPRLAIHVRS